MIKSKIKNIIIIIAIIISFIVLIISSFEIYNWYQDSKNIKSLIEDINEKVEISEVNDSEDVQIVEIEETGETDEIDVEMNLMDVDLSALKDTNQDTVGWIQVPGTSIDYPFVQTTNNDYYLNHSFDKSYNAAGWVFMDYRNKIDTTCNKNTILYGHNREDNTMFNPLTNLLETDWYSNSENHIIKLSTSSENTLWQVFSVYHIKTTNDYIRVNFKSDDEFEDFVSMIKDRSIYNFNKEVTKHSRILTLSTCYSKSEKMVMHAKLIKYAEK